MIDISGIKWESKSITSCKRINCPYCDADIERKKKYSIALINKKTHLPEASLIVGERAYKDIMAKIGKGREK